jgi:plasmid stabilization system protein ParE
MGCPVILTPQSIADLENIVRRIAADSPDRAREFGNVLVDRALSISAFPEMGRVVPEVGEPAVREIIHGSYRIIYETRGDLRSAFVLRFWHAARGVPVLPGQQRKV